VFADAPADWPHWSRTYRFEGLDSPVGSVGGAPPRPTEAWVEDGRGRPGAGRWSLGEGSITLWADAEALRNDRLAVDPQGTVLVRLAAALAEGREVWIDGFGHGAASEGDLERAVWHFVRHTPAGHATALALGVLLLALACAAVRFGAPIPPPPPPGRSTLEHGAALADAYRRARARVRPTQLLLAGAEQRLGTVSLEDWLATLRRTRPDLLREVELVELARTRPRGIEIDRLLPLSAALDTLLHAALENSDAAR
jgi:hypothetical protein